MSAKPEEKETQYLRNIKVKGFKSIREMDLKLNPLNVLIGANGSGKSNLLDVFTLLTSAWNPNHDYFVYYVKKKGGAERFLHFGSAQTDKILVDLFSSKSDGYQFEFFPTSGDSLEINLSASGDFNLAFKCVSQNPVYRFVDTTRLKKTRSIDDTRIIYSDAKNLGAFLYLFKNHFPKNYMNIVETVKLVAPFFDDFILEPVPENPETILWKWCHVNSDDDWLSDQLSDGTLRFICLATLLLQPNPPPLILIDEPELGLHPLALSILAELIQGASAKTQIIVATQSATFVDYFKPEDIIVVNRENEESTFTRLKSDDYKQWLEEFSLGELWEKNVIGGRL